MNKRNWDNELIEESKIQKSMILTMKAILTTIWAIKTRAQPWLRPWATTTSWQSRFYPRKSSEIIWYGRSLTWIRSKKISQRFIYWLRVFSKSKKTWPSKTLISSTSASQWSWASSSTWRTRWSDTWTTNPRRQRPRRSSERLQRAPWLRQPEVSSTQTSSKTLRSRQMKTRAYCKRRTRTSIW